MSAARAMAGVMLLGAAGYYWMNRNADEWSLPSVDVDGVANSISNAAGAVSDYAEGALAMMNTSKMRGLSPALLGNGNVRAFLNVIRTGEGTLGANGYHLLFGGGYFASLVDHPRQKVTVGRYTSTAAGAYQALASTWDETRQIMSLPDFSENSQDMFAIGRIAARGALDDVLAGRFASAVRKCSYEWASLPGSPYGQPVISWDKANAVYASAGGLVAA